MFANIKNFFKSREKRLDPSKLNKDEAKERLHLVLLQDFSFYLSAYHSY